MSMGNQQLRPAWVAAGIVLLLLFSLFAGNIWIGFFGAFALAVIWLFWLERSAIRTLESSRVRTTLRTLIVLLIASQLYASIQYFSHADRHEKTLTDIRITIVEAVSKMEMKNPLYHTLRDYHLEDRSEPATLEQVFRELYGDHLDDDGTWLPTHPSDDDFVYTYRIAAPDSIHLEASATFTRGIHPDFDNTNQQTGMFQSRVTLTEGGIRYERLN
jgi:branched-subunit amino acid ABC-type transport system permease component